MCWPRCWKSRVACPRSRYRSRRTRQRRLAPDMYPLSGQIQRASDASSSPRSVCRGSRRRSFPTRKPRWRSCASAWPTPSPICRGWRRRLRRRRKPQGHAVVRRLQARVPGRRLSAELRAAELLLPRRHRLRHPAQPGREDRQAGFRAVSGLEPGLSAVATSGRRSRPSFPCSAGFPPASGRACAWPWTSGGRTDPPAGRSGRPRTCRPPAW